MWVLLFIYKNIKHKGLDKEIYGQVSFQQKCLCKHVKGQRFYFFLLWIIIKGLQKSVDCIGSIFIRICHVQATDYYDGNATTWFRKYKLCFLYPIFFFFTLWKTVRYAFFFKDCHFTLGLFKLLNQFLMRTLEDENYDFLAHLN